MGVCSNQLISHVRLATKMVVDAAPGCDSEWMDAGGLVVRLMRRVIRIGSVYSGRYSGPACFGWIPSNGVVG
jgi:hypothetical protein